MKDKANVLPLGEVVEIVGGGTPSKRNPKFYGGSIPWATVRDMNVDELARTEHSITESGLEASSAKVIPAGDIVIATRVGLGKVCRLKQDTAINQDLRGLLPKSNRPLDRKYLFYWYKSISEKVVAAGTGATVQGVKLPFIKSLPIPLPPLEEQRRIVAVLDEAFEGLDRARAHAEANLENAREFFLSALREVFRNESRKWETNLPPDPVNVAATHAREEKSRKGTQTGGRAATLRPILGPYSLSVLDKSVRPRRGWKWTRLTDLARLESGHTPSRKHPEYWGGDVPWIGIKDARDHHGQIIEATLENTNVLGISNSSARVLPPDTVCLSRTASVGYVTVMGCAMATSQDFVNWICGEALSPEFLKFLLLAQGDEIRRFASGSVHQTIYYPEVKAFNICHPPVSVQREICTSLECIYRESAELAGSFEAKLRDLDDLRQSLLQRAFAGELT